MEAKRITNETELKKAFYIREEVFVKEQGVPLQDEFDQYDEMNAPSEHVLVYYQNQPVGTGRIRFVNGEGKLERICILQPFRSLGIGKVIINTLEEIARQEGVSQVKLHGQTHAEGFYHKLGYQTSLDEFMEDGIPHYLMLKDLSDK
ncbi:GNAT family N-acetyltransferase [Niallia sp. 01092]|uniref:GNAT family N-acetyltransferase n=1 Tax=unclassified Niallia TaxID=2837522 RepID=UPI003FD40B34